MIRSLIAGVALLKGIVDAASFIALGDSWGTYGREGLEIAAAANNITVDNICESGTTTADWAKDAYLVKVEDALERNPLATHLMIINGGNDAQAQLPLNGNMDDVVASCIENESRTLNAIFAKRPDLKVVRFGYDVFSWDKSIVCRTLATALLSGENPCVGGPQNISCLNNYQQRLHYEFSDQMDKLYEGVTSLNLLGTLQAADGLAGASIGSPNNDFYTAGNYFRSDCIHLTTPGFEIVYTALMDRLP